MSDDSEIHDYKMCILIQYIIVIGHHHRQYIIIISTQSYTTQKYSLTF